MEVSHCDEVADAIRRHHALGVGLDRFAAGSVPVYAAGPQHVIKLFPVAERAFFDTECAALASVAGRLSIATPHLQAAGSHGEWLYVVMTRLAGISLAHAWPDISREQRLGLMRQLGRALAELHALPTENVAVLERDWSEFVAAQRAACRERQTGKGLTPEWVAALEPFLERWAPPLCSRPVLLHTEVMREHLLVERHGERWTLCGLVDFEPAMLGAWEYEFASVGVFVTSAEPGLMADLLRAYGAPADDALPMRVMAYALLHRYSNLRWYLERIPQFEHDGNLERLAREWFSA